MEMMIEMAAAKKQFDVNPQYFRFNQTESAANTFTQGSRSLPVQPNYREGKSLVMEVFKAIIKFDSPDLINVASCSVSISLSTVSRSAVGEMNHQGVIIADQKETQIFDTATTDSSIGVTKEAELKVYDLTDGNGHGLLLASDTLYYQILGANNTGAKALTGALLFRMKEIIPQEWIGITQF